MALFDGLLGGGGSDPMDIYGDLFTEKQRAALRDQQMTQGLLNAAAVFSKAGQASRLPVSIPWGEAAQALGGSGDEAMNRMLKGMQVAEEVRKSQQERAILAKAAPYVEAIMAKFGLDRPTATKVAAQMTSGNAPIAPGAPTGGPPGSNAPPPPAPAYPSGDIGGPVPGGFQGDFPGDVPAPAKAAGLLGPPGQTDPWAQYAGLLGGGTGSQSPFDPTTLDPTGPRGSPDRRIQIEQLSGEAAPAMPFPTRQDPNKPRSAWEQGYTYDQPKVPFGQDPGDALPGQATRGDPRGMTPVIRAAAQRYGVDPEVALRVAQSEGLSQFSGDGGKSGTAFQLYTGGGLGNDFQKQTGLDPLDPKNEPAAIDWAMRNASRTGWRPYRGAAKAGVGPDAGLPGRTGIRIEPLGGDAAPAGATPPGTIPGLGDQPEALAALNAMLKMGGMKSDPFGSLLETYYKSPGYLEEKARTEEAARKKVGLEYDPLIAAQTEIAKSKVELEYKPKIEEAVQKLQSPILKEREQAKADIDRITKELEQNRNAALTPTDATIAGPDLQPVDTKISAMDLVLKQKDRADRIAKGDLTIRPGDIIGKPALTPGQTAAQTQRGKTGEEMTTVQVWTPAGPVTQQMTNLEAEARRKLVAQRGPGGAPQVGDIVDKPALTKREEKVAEALGEDFITLRRQAQAARTTIDQTHDLRAKLDSGIFTGLDANWNLFAAKLGDTLGWASLSNPEKVKNTEVYIANVGREVLSMVKDLRPASNIDLQFAERMAGGQNMSAGAIRELLDMRERYARLAIERHNEEAKGYNPAVFGGSRQELPMPPAYQQKAGTTPSGVRWKE